MAGVGIMQTLMAFLIGPVFDRALNPTAPDTPSSALPRCPFSIAPYF